MNADQVLPVVGELACGARRASTIAVTWSPLYSKRVVKPTDRHLRRRPAES
jgi:hypothetical protein